ncbi:MAG: hypothetical protein U9N13_02840 [Euryarchaeota archaeon]|nr:hypothetical protein [Euryarchaeota archaeon]
MCEANIPITPEDLEFARPPLTQEYMAQTFLKYDLKYIVYFGEEMFYVAQQDLEPLHPMYPDALYPEEIEYIFDLMIVERIRMIRYENGRLWRSAFAGNRTPDQRNSKL